MSNVNDKKIDCPVSAWTERARNAAGKLLSFDFAERSLRSARTAVQPTNWDSRSERWGRLMVAAQHGDGRAYDRLLREIELRLRRYYARRLPYPASDDARQDTLLAIHAKRHTYTPSRASERGSRRLHATRTSIVSVRLPGSPPCRSTKTYRQRTTRGP
jgi:RNA polymerase sigma-70 factor (ECF subfamily)